MKLLPFFLKGYFFYYSNSYLLIDYIIYLDPYSFSFSFANTNSLSFSFYFCAKDKGTEKKRAGLAGTSSI